MHGSFLAVPVRLATCSVLSSDKQDDCRDKSKTGAPDGQHGSRRHRGKRSLANARQFFGGADAVGNLFGALRAEMPVKVHVS
jgi:hypothetical protein